MLYREIKYEDFNGDEQTDGHHFHISKSELLELEVEYPQGFTTMLENIIKTQDRKELVNQFKQIILMAYGLKSPDGKSFIKSDELRRAFSQTAAYNALFIELAFNDGAAADFIKGILPKNMPVPDQDKPTSLPTLPPTPPTPPSA